MHNPCNEFHLREMYLFPRKRQFLFILCTVSEIEIDEILIGYTNFGCLFFEVVNGISIEADGNLLFEFFCIWIFDAFAEIIVFFPLLLNYWNDRSRILFRTSPAIAPITAPVISPAIRSTGR